MNRRRTIGFGAAAGVLIGLAGAPLELSLPAFLAPAALLAALEPADRSRARVRTGALAGLAMALPMNAITMYWIVGLLVRFAAFPYAAALPVGALLWLGQSLAYVVAGALTAGLVRRGAPGWLVLPAALTLSGTLSPMLFPWRFGLCQLPWLTYAQLAALGGPALLDFAVAVVGCAALELALRPRRAPLLILVGALLVPAVFGSLWLSRVEGARAVAPRLAVGVVQPNVSIEDKHDLRRQFAQLERLREETAALESEGAELVLWPESSYPYPLHRGQARDREGPLGLRRRVVHGPLLVGALTTDGPIGRAVAQDSAGRRVGVFEIGLERRFNSAVAVDADGRIVGIADKVHLLAFGEFTPLWDVIPWLQVFPRGLDPGVGPQAVRLAGSSIAVLNCYEDLLPNYVRAQAQTEPAFLANLTNDAWFGDTNAPHLHHMNARLRAIETGRDLVRAVNTGVSAHTSATGEDLARVEPFVEGRFVADVARLEGRTPWVVLGDTISPVCAAFLLALVLAQRRRRLAMGSPA